MTAQKIYIERSVDSTPYVRFQIPHVLSNSDMCTASKLRRDKWYTKLTFYWCLFSRKTQPLATTRFVDCHGHAQ